MTVSRLTMFIFKSLIELCCCLMVDGLPLFGVWAEVGDDVDEELNLLLAGDIMEASQLFLTPSAFFMEEVLRLIKSLTGELVALG